MDTPNRSWRVFCIAVFPLLTALLAAIYRADRFRYLDLLREDSLVEWLTVAMLLVAGLTSLDIAIQLFRRERMVHWFFFAFGLFLLLVALEEISWGQRLLALNPPDFFLSNSDQQEINIHNVLQQKLDFKTKDVAAFLLSVYGLLFPLLALNSRVDALFRRMRLVVPPLYLGVGFLFAILLTFDIPTGFEEEVGEFFFSLCFFFFMLHQLVQLRDQGRLTPITATEDPILFRRGIAENVALAALTIFGFALFSAALDLHGFWYAEALQAFASSASPALILEHAWTVSPQEPALWSIVVGLWRQVAGSSETALRFISAMSITIAVPLAWQFARQMWPQQQAVRLLSALMIAMSPALLWFAQDLSPYAASSALALLSLVLSAKILRAPTAGHLLAWMVVGWLLVATHLFTVTLLLVEAILVVLSGWQSDAAKKQRWIAPVVALLTLVPPLLWVMAAPGIPSTVAVLGSTAALEDWTYANALRRIWFDLSFGNISLQTYRARLSFLLVAPFLVGIYLLLRPRTRSGAYGASLNWLFLGVLFLPVAVAIVWLPALDIGALSFIAPLLLMAGAAGIVALWRFVRLVGLAILALTLLLMVIGRVTYVRDVTKSGYRAMAATVNGSMDETDAILLLAPQQAALAHYYLETDELFTVPSVEPAPYWPAESPKLDPQEVDGEIQGYLRDYTGLWLAKFEEESVDPGRFLPQYLDAVAYGEGCLEWQDVELCHYHSPMLLQLLAKAEFGPIFGEELQLNEVQIAATTAPLQDAELLLTELGWTSLAKPTVDYKVSLRLLDESGAPVAQQDRLPIGPLLPPTTWGPGESKPGYMVLSLPADLSAGTYRLQLVLYDPESLTTIPRRDKAGSIGDAPMQLATIFLDRDGEIETVTLEER